MGSADESANGSSNASASRGRSSTASGRSDQLVVVGAVQLGHLAGQLQLVERALLEPDREGAHAVGALARGERGERRRVDPAGQHHADRHVRDQMRADGVAQALAQLGRQLRLALGALPARRHRPRAGVAAQPRLAVLHDQDVTGRELSRFLEDRQRRRDRVEREERLERVQVDFTRHLGLAQQRLQLGRERQRAAGDAVVERLDPEAVAREEQALLEPVPQRDREHAPQVLDERRPPLLVQMDQHLRVALRGEPVSRALEPLAQLAVVVDLAVLHDLDAAVLVADRLVRALQVDDRQPPRGQRHGVLDELARAVGPAVDERLVHRVHDARVDGRAVERQQAADATHVLGDRLKAGAQDFRCGEAADIHERGGRLERAGDDAPGCRGADAQVQMDGAVGDVLEVVRKLLRP